MKFFVTTITRVKGSPSAIATIEKDDIKQARMVFHQAMASAYATADLEYAQAYIRNDVGGTDLEELIPEEVEPAPEPEEINPVISTTTKRAKKTQ